MRADTEKQTEDELALCAQAKDRNGQITHPIGTGGNLELPNTNGRASQSLDIPLNPQPTHSFTNRYRKFEESNIEGYFETTISTVQSPAISTERAAARPTSALSGSAESADARQSPVNWNRVVEVDLSNLDAMMDQIQKKKDKVI